MQANTSSTLERIHVQYEEYLFATKIDFGCVARDLGERLSQILCGSLDNKHLQSSRPWNLPEAYFQAGIYGQLGW